MDRRAFVGIHVATLTGLAFIFAGCAATQQPPCRESAVGQSAEETAAGTGDAKAIQREDQTAKTPGEQTSAGRSRPMRNRRTPPRTTRVWHQHNAGTGTRLREIDIHKVSGACQNCGHDIRDNKSGVCPRCGAPFLIEPEKIEPEKTKPEITDGAG